MHNLSASGQTKRVAESKCARARACVCVCVCVCVRARARRRAGGRRGGREGGGVGGARLPNNLGTRPLLAVVSTKQAEHGCVVPT